MILYPKNLLFCLFSLLLLRPFVIQMLVHLMLFHKSFKLYLLISPPAAPCPPPPLFMGWIPLPCLEVHWAFLLLHLVYCWMPILEFCSDIYLCDFCLVLFYIFFFVEISLCSCIVLLSLGSRFMTIILNLLSGKSSTFILFWGFILFLHLEHITLFLQLSISVLLFIH